MATPEMMPRTALTQGEAQPRTKVEGSSTFEKSMKLVNRPRTRVKKAEIYVAEFNSLLGLSPIFFFWTIKRANRQPNSPPPARMTGYIMALSKADEDKEPDLKRVEAIRI